MNNEIMIKEKLDFFCAEKVKVHVKKHDREFWNGMIIGKVKDGVWFFEEDKLGSIHLFEKEIYDIIEYTGGTN